MLKWTLFILLILIIETFISPKIDDYCEQHPSNYMPVLFALIVKGTLFVSGFYFIDKFTKRKN